SDVCYSDHVAVVLAGEMQRWAKVSSSPGLTVLLSGEMQRWAKVSSSPGLTGGSSSTGSEDNPRKLGKIDFKCLDPPVKPGDDREESSGSCVWKPTRLPRPPFCSGSARDCRSRRGRTTAPCTAAPGCRAARPVTGRRHRTSGRRRPPAR